MSIRASILIFCLFLIISATKPPYRHYHLKTIVLDAGHGGKDPGCIGRSIKEKEVNLDIALRLGKLIREGMPEVKIVFTRKEDKFIELHDRAGLANKNGADLFISIHSNSGPQGMHGTETYCMGLDKTGQNLEVAKRENSSIYLEKGHKEKYDNFDPSKPESYILFSLFQNAYLSNSLRLAEKIEREFRLTANRNSRGVKQAGFLVLWKTSMPSVLVESGFLTDKAEDSYLSNSEGRQAIAQSIYCALESYA
ncbi:MAG TPA: N-acetylmuramoyl-L-alanine amidase, partial [Cytophagaceae bacterium]